MSSIKENKGILRAIFLALLVVAIIGPWTYDLINVPAEYPCSAPFVRLEGDFCGSPVLGITMISWFVASFPRVAWELFTGRMNLADLLSAVVPISYILLLVLPLLTTLLVLLKEDSRPRQLFHVAVLTLASGLGLFLLPGALAGLHGPLWGMWLYFGLVVLLLVLEVLALLVGNRPARFPAV